MPSNKEYPCKHIPAPRLPGWRDACWEKAPQRFLADTVTGETPFLSTELRLFRDDGQEALFARFLGEDDEVLSTFRMHDECLYRQDVFELFIASGDSRTRYLEIEVSPYDLHFVADVVYQKGRFAIDLDREIAGFETRASLMRPGLKTASVWRIPYDAFKTKPKAGARFLFNAFRIDHHSTRGRSLQALSATGEANFHVPEAFIPLSFPA